MGLRPLGPQVCGIGLFTDPPQRLGVRQEGTVLIQGFRCFYGRTLQKIDSVDLNHSMPCEFGGVTPDVLPSVELGCYDQLPSGGCRIKLGLFL